MTTLKDFESRFYQLNDDFNLFTAKKQPATAAQIQAFEQEKSLSFPQEFKDFLTYFGTMVLEVKEEIWRRPKMFDVMPAWKFGYGMFIYGLDQAYPNDHWLYYHNNFNDELNGLNFYQRSGGLLRAYLNQQGEIFIETNPYSDWEDMEKYDGNLFDFLIEQVDELEQDYHEYISEKK